MSKFPIRFLFFCVVLVGLARPALPQTASDPLPSWQEGHAKERIVKFVKAVTDSSNPQFIPQPERIAAFDNDGTLWVEQPLYTQGVFALESIVALAPQHPEWKHQEPFKTVLSGDPEALKKLSAEDFHKIVAATHSGMSVEAFQERVKQWFATAKHPRFKRSYLQLTYKPMVELLDYLRANGFKTFIVTGGGQDFVRAFSAEVYGIPPEQVMGTSEKTEYTYREGRPTLLKLPEILLVDDKAGKPQGIHLMIGRRPAAAFGNSTGDQQMLEYTQTGPGARLELLVYHDDPVREYAYGAESKIGTFSKALMAEAKQRHWIVVSMKHDWKQVFNFSEGAGSL